MVTNLYHEARGEPLEGQIAVAKVVLNRGKDVCSVVYAKYQFSWALKRQKPAKPTLEQHTAANEALKSNLKATHYHALHVKPKWAKKLTKLTTIGNHVFYN